MIPGIYPNGPITSDAIDKISEALASTEILTLGFPKSGVEEGWIAFGSKAGSVTWPDARVGTVMGALQEGH